MRLLVIGGTVFLGRAVVIIRNNHRCPGGRNPDGRRAADAAASTRDQCHLIHLKHPLSITMVHFHVLPLRRHGRLVG